MLNFKNLKKFFKNNIFDWASWIKVKTRFTIAHLGYSNEKILFFFTFETNIMLYCENFEGDTTFFFGFKKLWRRGLIDSVSFFLNRYKYITFLSNTPCCTDIKIDFSCYMPLTQYFLWLEKLLKVIFKT